MSDETTLLSCPFCGGEARHYAPGPIDHHIECVECYADIHRDTEAEAIAAWNTRAPVEYDGWFYLPKPKESIVQYGKQRTEKTEHGYKVTQPVEVIESAIRSWSDELGEYIMKRICEAWSTRAELGSETCEFVVKDNMNESEGMGDAWIECSACHCQFDYYADDWLMKMSYCPNCSARNRKAVER